MEFVYIEHQVDFDNFAKRAQKSTYLGIDTEFLREKTFYPLLCLLQLVTDSEVVIVDPFRVRDITLLSDIFKNDKIVKIFHAASQDLQIIYKETGCLPWPIFDTQIAATLMGHFQQIGYANLVQMLCNVQLSKHDSYTDWSRRPLKESQLQYAADDVVYLPKLYSFMKKRLTDLGRLQWLNDEFTDLVNPKRYQIKPYERYKRLKRASSLNPQQLSAAREIAAWREKRALKRDIPRKWVLSDEQIVEACKREARSVSSLFMVRGIREKVQINDARVLAELMCKGLDAPPEKYPILSSPNKNEHNVDVLLDLMSAVVRKRARENDIAMQTLASNSDLVDLARGYIKGNNLMRGWRKEIVGNELLSLLQGELSLSVDGLDVSINKIR